MLYAPLLIAILVLGRFELELWLFVIAVSAAFLAHEPLATLARLNPLRPTSKEKFRQARIWLAIYSGFALPTFAVLLFSFKRWHLLTVGAVVLASLGLHIYLTARRAERKFVGELLGVVSLTLTAPAAYYVVRGQFDKNSLLLWGVNLLYFTSAIFYVKMRVSRSVQKRDANLLTWQCFFYHCALITFIGVLAWLEWFSALVVVAFVPITLRAFLGMTGKGERLNLKKIGIAELAYTLVFVIFLVLGLRASPSLG